MPEERKLPEVLLASLVRTLPTKLFIHIIESNGDTIFKGTIIDFLSDPLYDFFSGSEIFKTDIKDNGLIVELF
jgi:hypothetical protein